MSEESTATRYRKKPVVVDAIQWTGSNYDEVAAFTGPKNFYLMSDNAREHSADRDATAEVFDAIHSTWVLVFDGNWIIKGIKGEFYPCAADVFAETYEPAGADL